MDYTFITQQADVERLLPTLMSRNCWCADTETTGLDPLKDKVVLLQIGDFKDQYLIDTRRVSIEPLRPFFESNDHRKIFHNAKFDYKMIKGTFGIDTECVRDTFLAEKILFNGKRFQGFGLDDVCQQRLNIALDKSVRKSFIGMRGDFTDAQLKYAADDIKHLWEISRQQCLELQRDKLDHTYALECACVPCFADMEMGGFRLDVGAWTRLIEENKIKAAEAKIKINEFAKQFLPTDLFGQTSLNLGSPKQVLDLLHRMRVTIPERMSDGSEKDILIPDTNENTLNKCTKKWPILELLKDYRGFEKRINTYGQSFIDAIHPATGMLHAVLDQLGTETGRPASNKESSFNPLNVPRAKEYRNAFLARSDDEVVETDDYSGCELRIWAELSQDPHLMEAYARGEDIHCYAATKLFGVEVTKKNDKKHLRTPAKGLNFGIIYGMGPPRLYNKLNAEGYPISFADTKGLYYKYCDEFKVGITYLRSMGKVAAEQGFLANLNGRRRYWIRPNADDGGKFPLGKEDPAYQRALADIEREGGNFLVQSVNADMTKLAMVRIRTHIKKNKVRSGLLNAVYDEVVTSTHKDDSPSFVEFKRKTMIECAHQWLKTVPMEVEGHVGPCWTK